MTYATPEETDAEPPSFLLTAVVTTIGKVPGGDIIQLVRPAWTAILEAFERDPSARFAASPRWFEELIAGSYDAEGFDEVILTPPSGDFGRDVIATRKGAFSIRIIDQVKRYAAGNLVPAHDVRALWGTLSRDHNASKALLTTTSDFAPGVAAEYADSIPYRLELVNGESLMARLGRLAEKK